MLAHGSYSPGTQAKDLLQSAGPDSLLKLGQGRDPQVADNTLGQLFANSRDLLQ
jgi:hypothetical protein